MSVAMRSLESDGVSFVLYLDHMREVFSGAQLHVCSVLCLFCGAFSLTNSQGFNQYLVPSPLKI